MKIRIIGSGIIGLSTAYYLQTLGFTVEIIAKDFPPNTTSDKAAALWFPFLSAPFERVAEWGRYTYETYLQLKAEGWAGIELVPFRAFEAATVQVPAWKASLPPNVPIQAVVEGLPEGYSNAFDTVVPVVEVPIFLPFLMEKVKAQGGTFTQQTIKDWEQFTAANTDAVLVNCTGLGAKTLLNDSEMQPIQGQILRVKRKDAEHLHTAVTDDYGVNALAYIIPRSEDVVLGGTAVKDAYDTTPDEAVQASILRRCAAVEPAVSDVKVIASVVGLRPYRTCIRLERQGKVIHNYGHGGSGYTVNWGCAKQVAEFLSDF